jgi:hypothetical protein
MASTEQETDDALQSLSKYLAETIPISFPRQRCSGCHGSGTIYCPDCLQILLPLETWPESVVNQSLCLPFQLDILLDDRRASSTGVQVASILKAAGQSESCRIFDLTNCDAQEVPDYTDTDEHDNDGTYLLFPDQSAVPLSSVINSGKRIKRIIVMDCKWSKFSKTLVLPLHKALASVTRIKLDRPPAHSFYWRWHNAGDGAVSTIEAIYYAACQVNESCIGEPSKGCTASSTAANWLDLFWLFRLQRNIIADRYQEQSFSKSRAVPFSKEGKEFHRTLRRLQGPQQHGSGDAESPFQTALDT